MTPFERARRARLLILDVDGTVRWTAVEGAKYPLTRDQQHLMPGVADTLRALGLDGETRYLGVASNQEGVGLGELTRALAEELVRDVFTRALGEVPPRTRLELCVCPPSATCARKKPSPGLLRALLDHFRVEPSDALYVGDLPIDEAAAAGAHVPFIDARTFFDVETNGLERG